MVYQYSRKKFAKYTKIPTIHPNIPKIIPRYTLYLKFKEIENTSWKVLAYGIYARVVDVSEIERVSAANE